jgi:hypothetical protein
MVTPSRSATSAKVRAGRSSAGAGAALPSAAPTVATIAASRTTTPGTAAASTVGAIASSWERRSPSWICEPSFNYLPPAGAKETK